MILWRLHGVLSEIIGSIHKEPHGYRLRVVRGDDVEHEEGRLHVTEARLKAFVLRDDMIEMGFTSAA